MGDTRNLLGTADRTTDGGTAEGAEAVAEGAEAAAEGAVEDVEAAGNDEAVGAVGVVLLDIALDSLCMVVSRHRDPPHLPLHWHYSPSLESLCWYSVSFLPRQHWVVDCRGARMLLLCLWICLSGIRVVPVVTRIFEVHAYRGWWVVHNIGGVQ